MSFAPKKKTNEHYQKNNKSIKKSSFKYRTGPYLFIVQINKYQSYHNSSIKESVIRRFIIIIYFMSIQKYQIIQTIAFGSLATVYKINTHQNSHTYALKKYSFGHLTQAQRSQILKQIAILASIYHPFIVQFKQAFIETEGYLYVITELCDRGSLEKEIQKIKKKLVYFDQEFIWRILINITLALQYLHNNGILHRDVKPSNIYLTKSLTPKLASFRIAKYGNLFQPDESDENNWNPRYSSPEAWNNEQQTIKSDIWSLGCIIYQLCCLRTPFDGKSMQQIYENIRKGQYKKISSKYSQDLERLIERMLKADCDERLSCQEILNMQCVISRISKQQQQLISTSFKEIYPIINNYTISELKQWLPKPNYYVFESGHSLKKMDYQMEVSKRNILELEYILSSMDKQNIKCINQQIAKQQKNQIINQQNQQAKQNVEQVKQQKAVAETQNDKQEQEQNESVQQEMEESKQEPIILIKANQRYSSVQQNQDNQQIQYQQSIKSIGQSYNQQFQQDQTQNQQKLKQEFPLIQNQDMKQKQIQHPKQHPIIISDQQMQNQPKKYQNQMQVQNHINNDQPKVQNIHIQKRSVSRLRINQATFTQNIQQVNSSIQTDHVQFIDSNKKNSFSLKKERSSQATLQRKKLTRLIQSRQSIGSNSSMKKTFFKRSQWKKHYLQINKQQKTKIKIFDEEDVLDPNHIKLKKYQYHNRKLITPKKRGNSTLELNKRFIHNQSDFINSNKNQDIKIEQSNKKSNEKKKYPIRLKTNPILYDDTEISNYQNGSFRKLKMKTQTSRHHSSQKNIIQKQFNTHRELSFLDNLNDIVEIRKKKIKMIIGEARLIHSALRDSHTDRHKYKKINFPAIFHE